MTRVQGIVVTVLIAALLAGPGLAAAEPVSGPREVVDLTWTTTQPGSVTGSHYVARYHAAGDPEADPPYMERMVSYGPLRFDTSVPGRCTATNLELALQGGAACPAGSRIGDGTADGSFMGERSTLPVEVFNNTDEQIIVVGTPGLATVSRGTIHPDGAVEFASPTCYPALEPPGCVTDNALQIGSDITLDPITRTVDGVTRAYMTTPATCPASGAWETPITFWWSDGGVDTVVTRHPCTAAASAKKKPKPR